MSNWFIHMQKTIIKFTMNKLSANQLPLFTTMLSEAKTDNIMENRLKQFLSPYEIQLYCIYNFQHCLIGFPCRLVLVKSIRWLICFTLHCLSNPGTARGETNHSTNCFIKKFMVVKGLKIKKNEYYEIIQSYHFHTLFIMYFNTYFSFFCWNTLLKKVTWTDFKHGLIFF